MNRNDGLVKRGFRELRSRFITWLDRDTGLPRTSYFPAASGVVVTEESAMRVTAVFACVRILSWSLASLPLHVYRRLDPRGKERAGTHPLYRLLHERPNPEQTSFQFRSLIAAHQCLWGNGYAEIETDDWGEPVALWPIPAWRCEPRRTERTNELYYELTLPDGTIKKLQAYRILHFAGLGIRGDKGLSPIGMAREAVGLSMAAETFGATFFGIGLNPGGVATHPKTLSDAAHKRLKEDLSEKHEGLGKAHRLMLLEEGMTYERAGIAPEEAQFLETRKFQVADIARLYGVPPHMIGDTEKQTSWGTGVEQQGIGFIVYTMRPYLVMWEQEITQKLFTIDDQREYYPEFIVDGLLRGDIKARYASYAVGRQWGWLSVNDIRELENLNPVDGGDAYLIPLNMVATTDTTKLLEDDKPEDEEKVPEPRGAIDLEPIYRDAAMRIVRREEADVMRQARKLKPETLRSWLDGFYVEHRHFFESQLSACAAATGVKDLQAFAEASVASRKLELDALVDGGVELMQKHFDESRAAAVSAIAEAFPRRVI